MADVISKLNRLLAIHYRSLPMYLIQAGTWRNESSLDDEIERTLRGMIADYQATAARIATLILDRNGTIEPSAFPMEFTDLNFLSLEYLLGEILERHRRDLADIQRLVVALGDDPQAKAAAQEALGAAKAHLESLEALAARVPSPQPV